ncbi:hypothetical protein [Wolbachia endosymbiont (group A) of Anomoia purmunda]|uniref:hypothetical protein n=1 Tax=Wolbachia endosymbiont (group A) of Anomoia purmunda TaxID=2953978 RepID=UPI00397C00B0
MTSFFFLDSSAPVMSFQRVTLESSLYYAATWLKLSLLDPSVWARSLIDMVPLLKYFVKKWIEL